MKRIAVHILNVVMVIIMACACISCTDEKEMPDNGRQSETVKVPITISVGGDWFTGDDMSRAAPPDINTGGTPGNADSGWADGMASVEHTDRVRIIAFKRIAGLNGTFTYDASNDIVLELNDITDDLNHDMGLVPDIVHQHKFTQGELNFAYENEYRVIAIAYSSDREYPFPADNRDTLSGEYKWFVTSGTTYDEFVADITGVSSDALNSFGSATGHIYSRINRMVAIPQLFYGTIYSITDTDNPILRLPASGYYALRGVLYRGVAEVQLEIDNLDDVGGRYNWMTMAGNNILTHVGLDSYDAFLTPSIPASNNLGELTAVGYSEVKESDSSLTMTFYVLPCRTKLMLRANYGDNLEVSKLIEAADIYSAEAGTGIISTVVKGDEFIFMRNHKYILKLNSTTGFFNKRL